MLCTRSFDIEETVRFAVAARANKHTPAQLKLENVKMKPTKIERVLHHIIRNFH